MNDVINGSVDIRNRLIKPDTPTVIGKQGADGLDPVRAAGFGKPEHDSNREDYGTPWLDW